MQETRYRNKFSSARILNQGVDQGTVGGIYVYNVSLDVKNTGNSTISIFSDDHTPFVARNSGRDKEKEPISNINKFIEDRKLILNTAKSFELRIRLRP